MSAQPVDVLAVLDRRRTTFRDPSMRRAYEDCVAAFKAKRSPLFTNGERGAGNSVATMFWRGFTGSRVGAWDAASRKTFAYAQFRAGEDCAMDAARAAVAELVEAALERERLREPYIATIPHSSEVCTSPERDAYMAAVKRFDAALSPFRSDEG